MQLVLFACMKVRCVCGLIETQHDNNCDTQLICLMAVSSHPRAVQLYPHRFVGIVGQHDYFGVDNISVSHDGTLLASCAMEEVVRFWNIEYLYDLDNEESKKVSGCSVLSWVLLSLSVKMPCCFLYIFMFGGLLFHPIVKFIS